MTLCLPEKSPTFFYTTFLILAMPQASTGQRKGRTKMSPEERRERNAESSRARRERARLRVNDLKAAIKNLQEKLAARDVSILRELAIRNCLLAAIERAKANT